jgi:hypothetical protein
MCPAAVGTRSRRRSAFVDCYRSSAAVHWAVTASTPSWHQRFAFDEVGPGSEPRPDGLNDLIAGRAVVEDGRQRCRGHRSLFGVDGAVAAAAVEPGRDATPLNQRMDRPALPVPAATWAHERPSPAGCSTRTTRPKPVGTTVPTRDPGPTTHRRALTQSPTVGSRSRRGTFMGRSINHDSRTVCRDGDPLDVGTASGAATTSRPLCRERPARGWLTVHGSASGSFPRTARLFSAPAGEYVYPLSIPGED